MQRIRPDSFLLNLFYNGDRVSRKNIAERQAPQSRTAGLATLNINEASLTALTARGP